APRTTMTGTAPAYPLRFSCPGGGQRETHGIALVRGLPAGLAGESRGGRRLPRLRWGAAPRPAPRGRASRPPPAPLGSRAAQRARTAPDRSAPLVFRRLTPDTVALHAERRPPRAGR